MSKNFELLQRLSGGPEARLCPEGKPNPAAPNWVPIERNPVHDLAGAWHIEQQKLLRQLFLEARPSPRVVVMSGLDTSSGCTLLCAQLAELLAQQTSGATCLVDGDLRRPSLHRHFEVENGAGLADALLEAGEIRSYARPVAQKKLWLVTAGTEVPDAYTLLASERLNGYIAELRRSFDYVLIDSPAASLYTDSLVLGSMADGVALVIKANVSRRSTTQKVLEDFAAAHVRVLGAALNQRTFPVPQAIYSRL
ncbi:MAG TPA: CpsD/CapB family tyrosine-protein kinase [Terriglobales bacterium]|nr:CpsD/CapB family tyrosine-protein kinase [Terriglobales bacterium]